MKKNLRIEITEEGSALYLTTDPDGEWSRSSKPDEDIVVDWDPKGRAIGIEIIGSTAQAAIQGLIDGLLSAELQDREAVSDAVSQLLPSYETSQSLVYALDASMTAILEILDQPPPPAWSSLEPQHPDHPGSLEVYAPSQGSLQISPILGMALHQHPGSYGALVSVFKTEKGQGLVDIATGLGKAATIEGLLKIKG